MVKKFFSILLAGTIIFSLSACGKTSTEENQNISSGDSMQTESESTSAESISSDETGDVTSDASESISSVPDEEEAVTDTTAEENTDEETGKTLVAYFSWSGNTKEMASYIAEQTGGDVFEIQPVTPYPEDYQETGDIAKEERDNNARPEVLNMPEDISDYDTLFIGYPIWWHTAPMVIGTFLENYDLTGVEVYPFTQSSSMDEEQFNQSMDFVRECANGENVHDGLFVESTDTEGIQAYLTENGF